MAKCERCNDTGIEARIKKENGRYLNICCTCQKGMNAFNDWVDKCIEDDNITLTARHENCSFCESQKMRRSDE